MQNEHINIKEIAQANLSMILEDELKKFEPTYNVERLKAFIYSPDNKLEDVIVRYRNKGACFKDVFVNFPSNKNSIAVISDKLYKIRKLRNRIFHYEQVFKYPEKTLKLYDHIQEIISYLPKDEFNIVPTTSTFLTLYNQLVLSKK